MKTNESKEKPPKKNSNSSENKTEAFIGFKESFDKLSGTEEKIIYTIEFMRTALSKNGGLHLKNFWDAKHLCSHLFKKKMSGIKRKILWSQYIEINEEARRLKEILDEQVEFSIEQIGLAIEGLETDLMRIDRLEGRIPLVKFPKGIHKIVKTVEIYSTFQQKIHLFKTLAMRLDTLKKETISTEMRISVKNKILRRISKLGDQIFPSMKELVEKISEEFLKDVEFFVERRFKNHDSFAHHYIVREEIKTLQALSKILTLNNQLFTKTRKILSHCWEEIDQKEQERKKKLDEKSKHFKQHEEIFNKKIEAFKTFCSSESHLSEEKILKQAAFLEREIKTLDLSRERKKYLAFQIHKIQNRAIDQIKEHHHQKIEEKKLKVDTLKHKLGELIEKEQEFNLEELVQEEFLLTKSYEDLDLSSSHQHILERKFSDLRSVILDKKEKEASHDDDFEELLEERKELLDDIKKYFEECRKEMGSSRLDFEKAIVYRELSDSAKIHIDKELKAIGHLERKIAGLEND